MLLFTRKKILEQEFSVDTCTDASGLDPILADRRVDIAVLCHSVPDAECQEVLRRLRQHSPRVKVLVLYEALPEMCTEGSDKKMESLAGPSTLVDDVHALMEEAARQSATPRQTVSRRNQGVRVESSIPASAKCRSRTEDSQSSPSERM